ncbi:hypothetical protein CPB84DRAFT_1848915 [Gymnopilus junonius]|uniref:F-box domain-containing protein n=1 Tax=Gymnopilus junonius TaxID=109634 RepID=A0A9P5NHE3_GYMJU|nr:hypothetical protein CPB84DRAFT_1848915 [Gymnopilus junonius]
MFDIQCLSFDRVHRGRVTVSAFPLFRVPVELFAQVVRYLSRSDLKSLALVDRDCCRLASLTLFKEVEVDINSKSRQPLLDRNFTACSPSSIPHCIRRLDVSSPPSSTVSTSSQTSINSKLSYEKHAAQSQLIYSAIATSLSNLHILAWDGAFLSSALLQALQRSSVKHLSLKGIVIDPEDTYNISRPIPLETLHLEIYDTVAQYPTHFFSQLLRCVSPTLRQLSWIGAALTEDSMCCDPAVLQFPKLRSLTLDMISIDNPSLFHLLIGENTKVQSLSMGSLTPSACAFFRTRGHIKSLTQFCWINHISTDSILDDIVSFLQHNPQLETIQLPKSVSPTFLEKSFFPLLKLHQYDDLTSLHLVWDAFEISEQSLHFLASISTLRHLWLSAGNQGVRSTWHVDHESVINHLSPLHLLQTLAFSHDTYAIINAHPLSPRFCDYYATKALPCDLDISKYLTPDEFLIYQGKTADYDLAVAHQIEMRRRAWENWHAERMVAIANKYAQTFEALSWCFIGQLPMGRSRFADEFSIVNDSLEREPCLSSLHKMLSMTIWRPV